MKYGLNKYGCSQWKPYDLIKPPLWAFADWSHIQSGSSLVEIISCAAGPEFNPRCRQQVSFFTEHGMKHVK
jgi:hypothetical protein